MTRGRTIVACSTHTGRESVENDRYEFPQMIRILLAGAADVELTTLETSLRGEGYEIVRARTCAEVVALLCRGAAGLAVLVGRLADGSFGECVRAVRRAPGLAFTPLLVVGEDAGEIDRIVALELGADDFVGSDTSPREFNLRIGALSRRAKALALPPTSRERYGRIDLDRADYRVWVDRAEVVVGAAEFRLLLALASPAGRVHARQALEGVLIGHERTTGPRWLDARISRLRTRLHRAGSQIETVRGVGFRLASGKG